MTRISNKYTKKDGTFPKLRDEQKNVEFKGFILDLQQNPSMKNQPSVLLKSKQAL